MRQSLKMMKLLFNLNSDWGWKKVVHTIKICSKWLKALVSSLAAHGRCSGHAADAALAGNHIVSVGALTATLTSDKWSVTTDERQRAQIKTWRRWYHCLRVNGGLRGPLHHRLALRRKAQSLDSWRRMHPRKNVCSVCPTFFFFSTEIYTWIIKGLLEIGFFFPDRWEHRLIFYLTLLLGRAKERNISIRLICLKHYSKPTWKTTCSLRSLRLSKNGYFMAAS